MLTILRLMFRKPSLARNFWKDDSQPPGWCRRDETRGWTVPPTMRGHEQGVEIGALNKTPKRRGKGQKSPLSRIKSASISGPVVSLLANHR
jgi:hypothetical protein